MALEGCLEDLGIRDILQIVSLSKKSGILTLKNRDGEGEISFLNGQVIRASSTYFPETLGQLLRKRHLVTKEQVDAALKYQQQLAEHQPLGRIVIEKFNLSSVDVEQVVAAQIEKIVFSFFSWTQGDFRFELGEPETFGSTLLNPIDFMLEKGLSSQRLVVKGKKIVEAVDVVAEIDDETIDRELEELKNHQNQQGLDLLRGMLAELEHPEFGGGIILLILRYASEIMNRAIIFDVRGHQLVGVGQFGLASLNTAADEIVRKMQLKIEPDSSFARVLREKVAARCSLGNTPAEKELRSFLNDVPDEVFIGPLVSDGDVVALLYGDNYPDSRPLQAASAFEIFLSKAGLAMEQALKGQD